MKLRVHHKTVYSYDAPISYGLQQVRMMPKYRSGQKVVSWNIKITGAKQELEFTDHHNNKVLLLSMDEGTDHIELIADGEIETTDTSGVLGRHGGCAPLWLFRQSTEQTRPGPLTRKLARDCKDTSDNPVDNLHYLSKTIYEHIRYESGHTNADTTAEEAMETGAGVCQDHAHVFIAAARLLGLPARYVSGYLMMNDRVDQDASHAWAEAYVPDLGWVGFDISNQISPDERYVAVATGLDYLEAAPISGIRTGDSSESMIVSLQVQQ